MTSNPPFGFFNRSFQPLSRTSIRATTSWPPLSSSSWPETWSALWAFCSACLPCLSLPSSGQPGYMPLWVHPPLGAGEYEICTWDQTASPDRRSSAPLFKKCCMSPCKWHPKHRVLSAERETERKERWKKSKFELVILCKMTPTYKEPKYSVRNSTCGHWGVRIIASDNLRRKLRSGY